MSQIEKMSQSPGPTACEIGALAAGAALARRSGMPSRSVIMALGAAVVGSGCLFTDPINRAPNARIVEESRGPYYIETPIVVSASKSSDPDGDELTVEWRANLCTDAGCGELFPRRAGSLLEPLVIEGAGAKGRLEVVLTVRDEPHRAISGDALGFDILNRPPEVELQVQGNRLQSGSYLVGRELVAVSEWFDPDGDDVTLTWQVIPPPDSRPNELVFEEVDEGRWRLIPDVAGLWEIVVRADDGDGGVDTATRAVQVVADGPPCIAATEPPAPGGGVYVLGVDDAPRRFSVLAVDDELDPYPARVGDPDAGEASFRWLMASPATGHAFVELTGRDAPDLVVDPAEHAPGETLALRVEISDRVERDISCGEERLTCSIGDNACIQRTTWEVEIR
jgi:hypothetical protein